MPDIPCEPGDSFEPSLSAKRVTQSLEWLREAGQLVVGSGYLKSGSTVLALHTDFGTPGQDKETNQDYALAWSGTAGPDSAQTLLAVAIADGVTSSYRSEWASALACALGLRGLVAGLRAVTGSSRPSALELAQSAFAAAADALREVVDDLKADPKRSCPRDQYLLTWKHILGRGLLLQTTLTLSWVQDGQFHLAMIGDGALLWRAGCPGVAAQEEVLAQADLSTDQVRALGPCNSGPVEFDVWEERPWEGKVLCAICTDGVSRGLQRSGLEIFKRLDELEVERVANPAEAFVREIVEAADPAFDDNLTLVVLRRE